MADSRQVAGLVGPTLVAVTLSELLNPRIWDAVTLPVTYQAGMLAFVAGLAIVRVHNRWTARWPVLVTLVGWFGVIAGLGRMFATELAVQSANSGTVALTLQVGLLAIGAILTYKAFSPASTSER